MQAKRDDSSAVDAYIATFPDGIQQVLSAVRAVIRSAAPEAIEGISYQMPAFAANGKYFVYYAAYKKHIGLYPAPVGVAEFDADVAAYGAGKATLRFPYDQPLPLDLIRRIVRFRLDDAAAGPHLDSEAGGPAGGAVGS
ncbi:MAG: DUF1801 domain-containing protein [Ardenticatenales bacterium]|nr:DUF1801 domain-containing protein [Ardenticatenales bacterium]